MFLRNLAALFFPVLLAIPVSLVLNSFTPIASKNWDYGIIFLTVLCFILNCVYAYHSLSETFTQLLIVCLVIKLLAGLTVILTYSFIDPPDFFNFSIHFIIQYILFTIFEIRYLLFLIKKRSNRNVV
jgi:hypothetical protein